MDLEKTYLSKGKYKLTFKVIDLSIVTDIVGNIYTYLVNIYFSYINKKITF